MLSIRSADSADYDAIIGQLDSWWNDRAMSGMLPRLFFQHFAPWTFVAERNSGVVGFLAAFRSQTDAGQIYCHFIGVAPAERGRGLGEALYHRLFADARAAGCSEVLAVTAPVNRGSIAFHQRLGFVAIPGPNDRDGIQYFPNYDGPGEDRVRFRKSLIGRGARAADLAD